MPLKSPTPTLIILQLARQPNSRKLKMAQRITSSGIFHGLPEYDGSETKHSALIAGANGITGAHVVKVLNEHPDRWNNVYALSRKEPAHPLEGNVKYLTIDLLNSPSAIASQLKEVGPMYVLFSPL